MVSVGVCLSSCSEKRREIVVQCINLTILKHWFLGSAIQGGFGVWWQKWDRGHGVGTGAVEFAVLGMEFEVI